MHHLTCRIVTDVTKQTWFTVTLSLFGLFATQMLGIVQSTEAASNWPVVEAAMFVMTSVARDVVVYVEVLTVSVSVASSLHCSCGSLVTNLCRCSTHEDVSLFVF